MTRTELDTVSEMAEAVKPMTALRQSFILKSSVLGSACIVVGGQTGGGTKFGITLDGVGQISNRKYQQKRLTTTYLLHVVISGEPRVVA